LTYDEHDTQYIGWIDEGESPGTDPFDNNVEPDYWNFGHFVEKGPFFPNNIYELLPTYLGDSRDPQAFAISRQNTQAQIGFWPVNGLPLYYALGASTSSSSPPNEIHALSGIETGRLPTFTTRWETQSDSESIRKSAVGCKVNTLEMRYDAGSTKTLWMNMHLEALRTITPTYEDSTPPAWIGSRSDPFEWESSESPGFKFEMDPGGEYPTTDYSDTLLMFQYILSNNVQSRHVDGQDYPKWTREGNRSHALTFSILRGDDVTIDTIARDQPLHELTNFQFRVYTTSSYYIDATFHDAFIIECKENYSLVNKKQQPTYDVVAIAKNITANVKDGVAKANYGE